MTSDLNGAQEHLESEVDQFSVFQEQSSEQLGRLQADLEGLHSELKSHIKEKELLEQTGEEQRAELVRLRLAVSELELQKEELLFQSTSNDGTICSLKSQVHVRSSCFMCVHVNEPTNMYMYMYTVHVLDHGAHLQ